MKPGNHPLLQLTAALVVLFALLVVMADLAFGVFPDREVERMQRRQLLTETVVAQTAALLQHGDADAVGRAYADLSARNPDLQGLQVVQRSGEVVVRLGRAIPVDELDRASYSSEVLRSVVVVPLRSATREWGEVRVAFDPTRASALQRWMDDPLMRTLGFISVCGMLVVGLYVKRALNHLDPSSVIPERVQGAFDAMAEGVVVLDRQGRVLLTNAAFRRLNPQAAQLPSGARLSAQSWLCRGLSALPTEHPWAVAMSERRNQFGVTLELLPDAGESTQPAPLDGEASTPATPSKPRRDPDARHQVQQLLINCAPIADASGKTRGCLVTLADVSELHRANGALRDALSELSVSQEKIQRQNAELKRLATRDPLTGCLNRRAFNESFVHLFDGARATHTPLACIVLDIDHFKRVNDTHGHGIGDRVIQEVAKKLNESARGADLVCRYGGEEFVLVLPGLDVKAALQAGERIRRRIERDCGPSVREVPNMRVTVSVGVALLHDGLANDHALIDAADSALYDSKRSGRNRVSLALAGGGSVDLNGQPVVAPVEGAAPAAAAALAAAATPSAPATAQAQRDAATV